MTRFNSAFVTSGPVLVCTGLLVFLLTNFGQVRDWETLSAVVSSVDALEIPFLDFAKHYYPAGASIFDHPLPVEGYYYPSFFAVLMRPFAMIPLYDAMWLWGLVQIASLVLILSAPLGTLWKTAKYESLLYAVLCGLSGPLLHSFVWGQVSALLTAGIIFSSSFLIRSNVRCGAICLGFVAAVKLYPGIFIVQFFRARAWAGVPWAIATFVILVVGVPVLLLGFDDWWRFESAVFVSIAEADWVASNINSQYFAYVVGRYLKLADVSAVPGAVGLVTTLFGYFLAALNLGTAWLVRSLRSQAAIAISLCALFLTLPFVLKTSWPHYFCYLPLCQVILLTTVIRTVHSKTGMAILFITILGSVALGSTPLFNSFPHWSVYSKFGTLFFSNTLLLPALYTVGYMNFVHASPKIDEQAEDQ